MSLLNDLAALVGIHQAQQKAPAKPQPKAQAAPHQLKATSQPYTPSAAYSQPIQLRQPVQPQTLGAGFNDLPQGNNFNPGYTPLQASNNALPQPNLMAPQYPQGPNINTQRTRSLY